jgi:hypothetical protein
MRFCSVPSTLMMSAANPSLWERPMSLKLAFSAVVLLVSFEPPTEAHDIYSPLIDSGGVSCCEARDCRPAHYRMTAAGVEMYVDGNWIEVPEQAIQYRALQGDTGETGGGHWCGFAHRRHPGHVTRCAVLPPNYASAGNLVP